MQLHPEQKHLFYDYLRRWNDIVLSTRPINQVEAQKAIEYAYEVINLPCPEIYFVNSPQEQQLKLRELSFILKDRKPIHVRRILSALGDEMWTSVIREGENLRDINYSNDIYFYRSKTALRTYCETIKNQLKQGGAFFAEEISQSFPEVTDGISYMENETIECAWIDFAIKVLNLQYPPEVAKAYQELIKHCGLSYHLRDSFVVCDRPKKLEINESMLVDIEFVQRQPKKKNIFSFFSN